MMRWTELVYKPITEARVIVPDIGSVIVPREDLEKYREWEASGEKHMPYGLHRYRVDGWMCPKPPPPPPPV